jgi:hypothetical protein
MALARAASASAIKLSIVTCLFAAAVQESQEERERIRENNYFGRFASVPEAKGWIAEQLWLTEQINSTIHPTTARHFRRQGLNK